MNALEGKAAFEPPRPVEADLDATERVAPPRRRRRWIVIVLLLVIAGAAAAYFYQTQEAAPPPEAPVAAAEPAVMRLSALEVMMVEPSVQRETVSITGTLAPIRHTNVSTRGNGVVESVLVQSGDVVAEGDVIARLDTEELVLQAEQQQSAIEATRAQLRLAESQLESAASLVERGASPRSALESAQSNLDGLVANLDAQQHQLSVLQLNLANATIRAPSSGTVAERLVDPGQAVNPGTQVITLVDVSRMEVRAAVSLSDAPRVAVGQTVEVTVESLREQPFTGTIERIDPLAIEGSRSLPFYLSLDNADGMLRGGMFVTGRVIVAQTEDAITVPGGAIRTDEEGEHVLAVVDGHLERIEVATGRSWEGGRRVEIDDGLSEGETIVSQSLPELTPGMAVTVGGQ